VNLGDLDPESVVTPGIYVRRVVEVPAAVKVMDKPGAAA
jgi:acyl CoA:acetate/3-ketoacid CoA transferase alpha subunit